MLPLSATLTRTLTLTLTLSLAPTLPFNPLLTRTLIRTDSHPRPQSSSSLSSSPHRHPGYSTLASSYACPAPGSRPEGRDNNPGVVRHGEGDGAASRILGLHAQSDDDLSTIYLTRLPGGRSPSLLGAGGLIPPWVTQTVRHRRRLEHTHATRPLTRAMCAHTHYRACASRSCADQRWRPPADVSTSLPLWLAPLLVGRRRGGRSCRCGPSAAQLVRRVHVLYTCTR